MPSLELLSLRPMAVTTLATASAVLSCSPLCASSQHEATLSSSLPCVSSQQQSSLSEQPNSPLTPKPRIALPKTHPPPHTHLSPQFREKILCLEIMGVDSGRVLSQNPALHTAPLNSIHSVASYLRSKGIHQKDLPKIFGVCPKVLTSTIKSDLDPVFRFLSQELGVPDEGFRRVINKCPRVLACSATGQLKPVLAYLQGLGFRDLKALAYQDPMLLVSSLEGTLLPKFRYLEGLGLARDEVVDMILRCPALFTFSVERNFKPKFEYFDGEMKRGLEELRGFPQYFSFSLEGRIKPRHIEAVRLGIKVPLPLLLKITNEEFKELLTTLSI